MKRKILKNKTYLGKIHLSSILKQNKQMFVFLLIHRLEKVYLVDDIGLKDQIKSQKENDFDLNKAIKNYLNDKDKEEKKNVNNEKSTPTLDNKEKIQPEIDKPYTNNTKDNSLDNQSKSNPEKNLQNLLDNSNDLQNSLKNILQPENKFNNSIRDILVPQNNSTTLSNNNISFDNSNILNNNTSNDSNLYTDFYNSEINNTKLNDISQKKNSVLQRKKDLQNEINNLNNQILKKENTLSYYKGKLQSISLDNLNKKNKIKNLIENIKNVELDRQKNEANSRIINNELVKLYKLIDKLKTQQQNLQQQIFFNNSSINNLKKNLREEADEITKNDQMQKSIELDINKLTNENNHLENNRERLKDILSKENIEMVELEREEEKLREMT
ncbi:hypothetical protein H312_00005 [Anncaliia algerae PRA339]|uniref:Uncharacterized protein n=1 Tax=Anncaliia algerae PRA339 TaxID=1288291 RepID=A0A059F5G3_9MICR|nr:hypothetical protein H312_00005 [Anncaliia algerae PRA339]